MDAEDALDVCHPNAIGESPSSTLAISRSVAGGLEQRSKRRARMLRRIGQLWGGDPSWPIRSSSPPDLPPHSGQQVDKGCFLLGIPGTPTNRDSGAMQPMCQEDHEGEEPKQTGGGALDGAPAPLALRLDA